jgi:hypothetical protein
MNDHILKAKLDELQARLRAIQNHRHAAIVTLGSAAGIALLHAGDLTPRSSLGWFALLVALPTLFVLLSLWLHPWKKWDHRSIARLVESRFPELNAVLLTATENLTAADAENRNVFTQRVLEQAVDQGARQDWVTVITQRQQRWVQGLNYVGTLALFLMLTIATLWHRDRIAARQSNQELAKKDTPAAAAAPTLSVTLTPGDVEIERGSRVIVEATFAQDVPPEATLVVSELDGAVRERLPMRLTVDGQVFGGLIARVDADAHYHVDFEGGRSQQHRLTTFVYPALVRADVKITPPAYTGLPVKEIKNTLKVNAMEGSTLDFTFQVSGPVKEAELFGEDKTILPLKPSPTDPTQLIATMKAEKTQRWRVHLVDAADRANKNPPWLSVKVQANQLAKIEVVFPKRDIQVSAIQELPVEAKVWDDLGVTQSGVSFSLAGQSKEVVFKHGLTAPAKKQDVRELLALEHESAQPRQLVSYHFWAEDKGPQGEVRRAMSDMFFADVRHFEDIFREAEAPPPEPGEPKKETDLDKLVKLEKEIVNATWKLIRDANAGRTMDAAAPDVSVVQESQNLALEQTKELMEKAEDPEIRNTLTEAWKSMKDAQAPLTQAAEEKKRASLNQALTFEQSALEWLHRAQSREHRVMRQNQPSESASASEQSKQNQIMNLELKQEEQRYEEEKKATPEQTAEQQENLQVLNRLNELARRQEALAEKMKELQKQLEKAQSEEEKQELANQLKRLQDEQEQLLRDVDDLQERMDTSENTANLAEAKDQLEQTREQVMDAAEKLKQQQLAEAANAATRAQRELEVMQEDFKQKTAKRFTDEMTQVRQQARSVAEAQKQISEALENQKTPKASSDTSAALEKVLDGSQIARKIEDQASEVKDLLENMRRLSEQAEGNNPLLHRRLYEAVRDAQTGGLEENLEEARLQSRYGNRSEAQDAERQANTNVTQLQQNVEKAAESVLGSETESLRLARSELDKLIEGIQQEEGKGEAGGQGSQEGQGPQTAANTPSQKEDNGPSTNPTAPEGSADIRSAATQPVRNESSTASNNPKTSTAPNQPSEKGQPDQPNQKDGQATAQAPGEKSQKPGEGPDSAGGQKGEQPDGESGNATPQMAQGQGGQSGQNGQKPGEGPNGPQDSTAQNAPGGQGGQGLANAPEGSADTPVRNASSTAPTNPNAPPNPNAQGSSKAPNNKGGQGLANTPEGSADTPVRNANSNASNNTNAPNQPTGQGNPPNNKDSNGLANAANSTTSAGRNLSGNDRRSGQPQVSNADRSGGAFFFDETAEQTDRSPLTGSGYQEWTDRLRNVEELLTQPQLRNEAAKVLDNARALRIDHERNNLAPQSDHLGMRITQPLVELRNRVAEELAKRDPANPTVPVDRDPVPPAFRDLVKRYYQELGHGN